MYEKSAMDHRPAPIGVLGGINGLVGAQVAAEPRQSEMVAEHERLMRRMERLGSLQAELRTRLEPVRASRPAPATVAPKEAEPSTQIGMRLRAATDGVDALIAYTEQLLSELEV
jgi:hypothetical protein